MKPVWTYILIALWVMVAAIFCVLYFSKKKEYNEYQASFNERSQIVTETNKKVVDSIKKENTILATTVLKYRAQYDSLQKVQAKIITNAKAIRNEINNTPDSGQLALLYRLLSEHRATPVARD